MSVGRNRLRTSCFKVKNADLGDLGAARAQLPSFTSVPWKESTHHFVMGTGVGVDHFNEPNRTNYSRFWSLHILLIRIYSLGVEWARC